MTRRLIAGLLTLCMLVSLCPPNAFALRSSAAVVPETESTVVEPAAEEPKAEEPAAEEPAVEEPQTEDTPAEEPAAEDPAAEDPQTEEPAVEEPKAEEETPKYATVNVNGSVKLTASAEDGGKWASDNIAAATVGAEKADAGEKNAAEVFGVAEGYTTVTYTKGDAVETWIVTVKAAPAEETPAEETPAEEEPADVTYSVSRILQEEAPEGSEVPFTYTLIDTISVTGKPGAEVTLPAVPDAIAVDTDADDIFPNEDGTAALTLPAETPEEHSLSVFYVKAEARPDISEMDIVNPATKIDTYIFKNGDTVVSTQKIKAGEAVYAPASPEKEGYKFTGWKAGDGSYFTPGVKETVTGGDPYIYTAEFAQVYYVFFLNTEDVVCATKEGVSGETISANVTFPVNADESITGWYTESTLTNKVDSVIIKDSNITLYPNVEKGYWITYNSDGGSYTAPVFVHANDATVAPSDPTRVGYTFQGWYNGDTPFAFGSELTENVTLTAKWKGNAGTKYTVIHWQENADDDNFSFQESETLTGTAGETTAAVAKSYDGFTVQEIKQQTISGDGSTIVNVYYNRNVYTINFWPTNGSSSSKTPICGKEEHTHNWRCYDWWDNLTCTKEEHTHDSSCFETSSDGALFTITAKYGAYIRDQWPLYKGSSRWSTQKNGGSPWQNSIDNMPLNGADFYVPSDNSTYLREVEYYVSVLPGETAEVTKGGVGYKIHHVDSSYGSSSSTVGTEDRYPITGFTLNETYSSKRGDNYASAQFFYDRNSYNINFYNNGSLVQTVSKLYQADISDVSYTPALPAGIPAEYEFKGWYDNELCEGDPYVFSGTMPAKNITVYAKWAAPTVSGTAYLTMDGVDSALIQVTYGSTIDESTLPTDEAKAKMPAGYTWRGWATKDEEGNYIPFNFDTRIFSDITLYPYYTSNQSFKVTYNANGGIGTAPSDTKTYADGSYADVMTASNLTAPEGKVFLGWGTEENGGTIYQPGDKIAVHVANITLYAIWGDKAALATLTYNPNGGTGTVTTEKNHLNNESVTLKSNTDLGFTRTGYKFLGWSTTSTATEAEYLANAAIIVDNESANTLYAVWKKMDFQVTYSYTGTAPTGAPAAPTAQTRTYGDSVTVEDEPTFAGYTFSGWTTTDAEVTDRSFTMPDKNVAFTGTWTEKPDVTISYVATIGGSVSLASESVKPATGKATGSTATADDDYYFVSWTNSKGDVVGTNASFTPSKNSDGIYVADTYTAHFAPKTVVNVTITGANSEDIYKGSAYTVNTADFTLGGDALPTGVTITLKETVPATVSRTDVGTTKMGLNADSFNINNVPYNYKVVITNVTDGYVTVTPKAVTVTANDNSKTYGDADPELTATVTGTLNGDTVSYSVARAEGEDVGHYEITASGAAEQGNYAVSYVKGDFEITKNGTMTVTGVDYEGTYDAAAHGAAAVPSVTEGTSLSYSVDGGTTWTSEVPTITNVGTVNVTVKATNPNYAEATDTYTLTVTPKAVTVTANDNSKTYGDADPELTATVTGTLNGDTVSYSVARAEGETVGTYDITPSGDAIQGNYKVSYEEGVFTITAQSISPTGPDTEDPDPNYTGATVDSPADHVYDSNEHKYEPVVKNGKSETLTKGTDYTVTYDRADFVNVGTIKVTITGIGNYSGTVTRTYQITPASVTVTADNKSKTYGSDDPELTASVEGTIGSDTVDYNVTRADGEAVGTYTITPSGDEIQGNYKVSYEEGVFTITAQSISPTGPDTEDPDPNYLGVTVGDLGNLVYNGLSQEQEPVVKDKNKVDLVKGTDYTLSYSTDTTNVGTVTVTVTGTGNYTGTVTRTYKITPAPYTVTTYSAVKVFDGNPLNAGGQVNGLVNGETCTVNTTASRTDAGTTENKPYTLTWGTAKESNYKFDGETIGTLTVIRQSINPTDPPVPTDPDAINPDQPYYIGIIVEDPDDVMYNGQSQKRLPVVEDSKGNVLVKDKDYTLSYSEDTVNVGTVTVTITGIGNYQGVFIHLEGSGDGLYTRPVTYQITPRRVVLKSESATKVYDGTALTRPNVAVSGDGFVAGEVTGLKATGTVTNVTETPVINTITYTTGADFKATNYIIEKAEGELSITKAEVGVVTVSGLRDTYWWTGAEREVTGFIHDGEDRLITVTIKDKDKAVARGTEVGRYYMGLKETDFTAESPNYYKVVVKVEDGYLDIVPINITVTVTVRGNRDTVTFDGNPHTVEGYEVVSAIANTGRDMGMDGITLKFNGDASVTGTEVGTYDMGLKAADFTVECDIYRVVRVVVEDGGLEITPAPEEITEPTEEIPDETVPLAPPEEDNIPDEPVPQAGPAWALVNLILSILTVLASLLLLVGYFGKKEEEAEDENGNAILDAEGNNVMNDIKKRGGWRLASLVPAILSVIAFLLTENMRNPMILVDRWTLLMVIIAVVQVLVMLLSKKKTEDNTQEA